MKKLFSIISSLVIILFSFFYIAANNNYVSALCDIQFCTPSECIDPRCNTCDYCLLCDSAFCTPSDCGQQRCWGCGFCDPDRCDIAYCTPTECGETRCRDCSFCGGPTSTPTPGAQGVFYCQWWGPTSECQVDPMVNSCASGFEPDPATCSQIGDPTTCDTAYFPCVPMYTTPCYECDLDYSVCRATDPVRYGGV